MSPTTTGFEIAFVVSVNDHTDSHAPPLVRCLVSLDMWHPQVGFPAMRAEVPLRKPATSRLAPTYGEVLRFLGIEFSGTRGSAVPLLGLTGLTWPWHLALAAPDLPAASRLRPAAGWSVS